MKKSFRIILVALFLINITSIFVSRDGGVVDLLSYTVRISLYLFVLFEIYNRKFSSLIKSQLFYELNIIGTFLLLLSLFATTILESGKIQVSVSLIFPTFFIFADNLFFMYAGYCFALDIKNKMHFLLYLRYFAIVSIIGMTFITIYVVLKYGSLALFWDEARSLGGSYTVFLNAYKNANPYKFALLIPFLFLVKNKYNIFFVVLCIINIIIAGKRGPLLALIMASFVLFLLTKRNKMKYIQYAIYAFVIFAVYFLIIDDSLFQNMIYRMDPTQHHYGTASTSFYLSGRDNIWNIVFEKLENSSFFSLFFGHGILGSLTLLADSYGNAHNTWIEILYNYGVFGLLFYIAYYSILIMACIKMWITNYKWKGIAIFLIVFSFVSSFYTVTIYGGLGAPGYSNLLFSFIYAHHLGSTNMNRIRLRLKSLSDNHDNTVESSIRNSN